jgi:hypothetical protein
MYGRICRASSFFEIISSCIYPLQRPENVKQSFCHRTSGLEIKRANAHPRWPALRQRADEALSRQSHLKLSVRGARDGVHTLLLQCESFLNRTPHLHDTTRNRKTLIVATFAGLALMIVLFLEMGMSDQAGIEHAGSVKESHSSLTQIPDWTIFDDAFANDPTRLATSEFVDRVRTSSAALTSDRAETTGQVMREPVPLPRPRPKRR